MTRWRRALLPVLAALPVFAVLVFLGTWQVERLRWKTALLAQLAATEAAPPVPLPAEPAPFAKVEAAGRFDHAREATIGVEVRGTSLGTRLVTPLRREGAPPVLVVRGWVPIERTSAQVARPEGEVRVTGYVNYGETAGMFAAVDDVAGRRFYTLDPKAIGAALGLPEVAPYALVALGPGNGTLPDPARHLPEPRNSHLGYVITWYGLAAALVGVLVALVHRRLKDTPA